MRSRAGGEPVKTRRRKTAAQKRGNAPTAAPPASSTLGDLQGQVSILTRELADAREQLAAALQQQTASSEVLNVVSSSPGELQPVFDTILQEATRVCQANFGLMIRYAILLGEIGNMHDLLRSSDPRGGSVLA